MESEKGQPRFEDPVEYVQKPYQIKGGVIILDYLGQQ
jgi:hypothetical protein